MIQIDYNYCPALAGPSVHWARNLRRTFEPDVVYDDENCGTGSSSRIVNPQLAEDETTVELFPNPSTDYLNVLISKNPYQTYAIYDQLGRMVLKGFIMEQSDLIRISTEALSQGQYILRLKGEESESSHQFIKADK